MMPRTQSSCLLHNARIYRNANDTRPADAILVEGSEIRWVGSKQDAPHANAVIDAGGATVLPGLTDAHVHLFAIANASLQLDASQADTISSILTEIAKRAKFTPAGQWVQVAGFDENRLKDRRYPTREELDAASPDHPVVIRRFCGHVAIVNTAALGSLGIPSNAGDPEGGSFGRSTDGTLDGSAAEAAAELIFGLIPPFRSVDLQKALLAAMRTCNSLGITAAVEAAVGFTSGFDAEYAIWSDLRKSTPTLPLRLGFMLQLEPDEAANRGLRPLEEADWQQNTLKFFSDGIVGARTAAMFEPYEDTGTTGLFIRPEAELERLLLQADQAGWRIAVHSAGDRSTSKILDIYEKAAALNPRSDPRHRIEHFFCPPQDGYARMVKLGALLVMQPGFLTRMRDSFMPAFGSRIEGMYPGKSAIEAGVAYVASSDAPTGYLSPWVGVADAMDRGATRGSPVGLQEALTAREAIGAYIHGGAYAMKHEGWRGELKPGMAADLVVLDRDPLQLPPREVRETRTLMTMIRGMIAYDAQGLGAASELAQTVS